MFLAPVAAPRRGTGEMPSEYKVFRAQRMRIEFKKNSKFSLNRREILLKFS